ncbi:mucin-3A-like [Dendropsophus ebraccatus]|uniref:mucin-3A-like n=1 Tax=Dendropsophus ebraccatus TaxID=150705 RepID=UPI0038321C17
MTPPFFLFFSVLLNIQNDSCISNDFSVIKNNTLKSEEEWCLSSIPNGFQNFYDPVVIGTGLICMSYCDAMSNKFPSCHDGICQIVNNTGPRCLCPRTDLYIYSSPYCNGRILKSGLYGGLGAGISVLLIIFCVGFYLVVRKKNNKKWDPFATDDEGNWCDDVEDEWHTDRGISNLWENSSSGDSSSGTLSSNKEKFKPNLESVDTTFEIKIQRPQVS